MKRKTTDNKLAERAKKLLKRGLWFWVGASAMFLLYTATVVFTTVNPGHIWDLVRIHGEELIIATVGSFALTIATALYLLRPKREKIDYATVVYDNLMVGVFAGIGMYTFSLLDPVMAMEIFNLLDRSK